MTAKDAIDLVDALRPNQYGEDLKVRWLNDLDGQIYNEICKTHAGCPEVRATEYTPETELLVQPPYDMELYEAYLESKVDEAYKEMQRYEISSMRFNHAYNTYAAYYNTQHKPLSKQRFRF